MVCCSLTGGQKRDAHLVDGEGVAGLDLLGLGVLNQDPLRGLAHGQRL